ncbi:MAG TPA: M20/M25/M40 family metallo-hydrolase [Firmicutes bacterium]|nr:M20/M25/M40 family metallo-hydrolase [Bacillota bacterium]
MAGRHVVFNGHLDTFPVVDPATWSVSPFSGEVRGGRLYGRGAAYMKGGVAASLVAFVLLYTVRECLPGRVSLTLVSDEETGSTWGTNYLLQARPDLRGDGLINGEPSSPVNVRIGEKGMYWFRFLREVIRVPSVTGDEAEVANVIARSYANGGSRSTWLKQFP